jgi:uncharacterized membrane protein
VAPIRSLALALTVAALLWTAAIVTAPRALGSGRFGVVAAVVYAGSSRICHQRPERSFSTEGLRWPVCARCAGLYFSGALGALLGWFGLGRWRASGARWLLVIAALPTATTWGLEVAGLASFSNMARAVAAIPLGIAAGWLFIRMLRYDSGLDAGQIDRSRTTPLPG